MYERNILSGRLEDNEEIAEWERRQAEKATPF
jgi:hypothetical protein